MKFYKLHVPKYLVTSTRLWKLVLKLNEENEVAIEMFLGGDYKVKYKCLLPQLQKVN